MEKSDIVILTEKQFVKPENPDWFIEQVLLEDRLLQEALKKLGYNVSIVEWSNPEFDWSSPRICVFRSIWDYFHRYDEFSNWLNDVKDKTQFVNSIEQIIWNVDKHYLSELDQAGVPIVESYFIEKGTEISLTDLHTKLGWSKTVIKPCVSGGGRHTYLLDPSNYSEYEGIFQELISAESLMLQPFQENITTKGEVSHIVIGGKYTHSILKKAKSGDYRVQDDFGGSVHDYSATEEEIEFAEMVAKKCNPIPAYARIDLVWDNNNELAVGEVELIEPELWFRNHPEAAVQLANEIHKRLQ